MFCLILMQINKCNCRLYVNVVFVQCKGQGAHVILVLVMLGVMLLFFYSHLLIEACASLFDYINPSCRIIYGTEYRKYNTWEWCCYVPKWFTFLHTFAHVIMIYQQQIIKFRLKYIVVVLISLNTVKPVCNDHLYNKIYYLWFIQ